TPSSAWPWSSRGNRTWSERSRSSRPCSRGRSWAGRGRTRGRWVRGCGPRRCGRKRWPPSTRGPAVPGARGGRRGGWRGPAGAAARAGGGDRLRQPALWRDKAALARLAGEAGAAQLSPQLAAALGLALLKKKGEAVPLLREAQVRHPHDFWLNVELAVAFSQR